MLLSGFKIKWVLEEAELVCCLEEEDLPEEEVSNHSFNSFLVLVWEELLFHRPLFHNVEEDSQDNLHGVIFLLNQHHHYLHQDTLNSQMSVEDNYPLSLLNQFHRILRTLDIQHTLPHLRHH